MPEPRLEDIDDYNTLKGGKKKVVWLVVLVGVLVGVFYVFVANKYDNTSEIIKTEDPIKAVPVR